MAFCRKIVPFVFLGVIVFPFAYAVLKTFPPDLPAPHFTKFVWLGLTGAFVFTGYFIFYVRTMSSDWTYLISMVMILFYVGMIIACFALIYVDLGILTGDHRPVTSPASCLYFSAITFTTVGYGDYIPNEATRFVAVLEAVWGYFTLGILVALGVKIISKR